MNAKRIVGAVCLALQLGGCGAIAGPLVEKVGTDLERTSELAKKYNKPAVAKCADWMLTKVAEIKANHTGLDQLRSEPTDGLLSASLKAALLAEFVRSLEESNSPAVRAEFKAACGEVAGDILLNIVHDAARIAKRIN